MKPEFATVQAWEQADCLMQPALIRTIDHLRQGLESCPWRSRYEEVEKPIPGHRLILENEGQTYGVNVWDLCFQVCFANYQPQPFEDHLPNEDEAFIAEIDQQLFNDQGEVDWTKLDDKARHCVTTLLAALPTLGQS